MESCQHPLKSAMRICMIFVLWSITLGWPQEMPPDIRDSKYYTITLLQISIMVDVYYTQRCSFSDWYDLKLGTG